MLLGISSAFTNVWFILGVILGTGILVYLFKRYKVTAHGKYTIDSLLLKLPIIKGNIQKTVASRFTRSVSLMLRTGVSIEQALDVADKVINNQVVTKGLMKVKEDIKMGSNLSGPLEEVGIFPLIVTQMVSVGEESGSLDTVMDTVADFCDSELDASISKLVALLEPIMIVCMSVIIGFVVISMILPMFGMYSSLKTK
jgi:type IV pilus assembly protein PilC